MKGPGAVWGVDVMDIREKGGFCGGKGKAGKVSEERVEGFKSLGFGGCGLWWGFSVGEGLGFDGLFEERDVKELGW